jgi:hypothetical protein
MRHFPDSAGVVEDGEDSEVRWAGCVLGHRLDVGTESLWPRALVNELGEVGYESESVERYDHVDESSEVVVNELGEAEAEGELSCRLHERFLS